MAMHHSFSCICCGVTTVRYINARSGLCLVCYSQHNRESQAAVAQVLKAVMRGDLKKATTCSCVDCGAAAAEYEHRDYTKPLDVVPVCRSCNRKRGPALNSRMRSIPTVIFTRLIPFGRKPVKPQPLSA